MEDLLIYPQPNNYVQNNEKPRPNKEEIGKPKRNSGWHSLSILHGTVHNDYPLFLQRSSERYDEKIGAATISQEDSR